VSNKTADCGNSLLTEDLTCLRFSGKVSIKFWPAVAFYLFALDVYKFNA